MNQEPKFEGGRFEGMASTAPALESMVSDVSKMFGYPVKIRIDECGSTLDYKALLMGFWFPAIAKQLTERGKQEYTANEIHDIACHKFLGYTPERTYGKQIIPPQLITITKPKQKTRPELYAFARSIELWCEDLGVTLPEKDSEYAQDKAKESA